MTHGRPEPVTTLVCDTCELPWEQHIAVVQRRLTNAYYAGIDDLYAPAPSGPAPRATDRDVSMQDCIAVLKKRFTGPVGPTGPQGAAGARGAKGESGRPLPQSAP